MHPQSIPNTIDNKVLLNVKKKAYPPDMLANIDVNITDSPMLVNLLLSVGAYDNTFLFAPLLNIINSSNTSL
jgi:hypothetical protein